MVERREEVLRNQRIDGERLILGPDCVHVLGPDLTIANCEVIIRKRSWTQLDFRRVRFENCTIRAGRKFHKCSWAKVELVNCIFMGTFVDNQFGRWRECWGGFGVIDRCDFRLADVTNVRIFGAHVESILFPPWPFFVVLAPQRAAARLRAAPWPDGLAAWADSLGRQPTETAAVVYRADELARTFKTSAEAVRRAIVRLDRDVVLVSWQPRSA